MMRVGVFQNRRIVARYEVDVHRAELFSRKKWRAEIKNKLPAELRASEVVAINVVTEDHPFDVAVTLATPKPFSAKVQQQQQRAVTVGRKAKGEGGKGRTMAAVRRAARRKAAANA